MQAKYSFDCPGYSIRAGDLWVSYTYIRLPKQSRNIV